MSTPLLIDEVATPERARLRTLMVQQERVRDTIASLRQVGMNDDFFSVASAEFGEASNADRVLTGEIKIIEAEIVERIADARREADAALRAELKPMYRSLLKQLEAARDARRKILARVAAHVDRTGSIGVDAVAFGWLEALDVAHDALRREGVL